MIIIILGKYGTKYIIVQIRNECCLKFLDRYIDNGMGIS